MIKEIITLRQKTAKLSVVNNNITAFLKADDVKTGIRLYSDSCIGIAGAIGAYNENELIDKAKHMLNYKIPYEPAPTENNVREWDLSNEFELSDEEFINTSTKFLDAMKKKYPDFHFSNIIRFVEEEKSIKNDAGTNLLFRDKNVTLELLIKYKGSANLMDGVALNITRMYSFDECFKIASETCDVYKEKADFEQEKVMPVVFLYERQMILQKFLTDLFSERYATGSSLFSGKAGQKLFADNFSLYIDRSSKESYNCFFDGEGSMLENDCWNLIQNGILISPYSAKKAAKRYNLPSTASAGFIYDDVPDTSLNESDIKILSSGKTIKELLDGREAVYVICASGGDFTMQGEFASPVQIAYLFDGEKITARLPQLAISSNIYDMFGKDFIGSSNNGFTENHPFRYLAMNMTVKKIGGHI